MNTGAMISPGSTRNAHKTIERSPSLARSVLRGLRGLPAIRSAVLAGRHVRTLAIDRALGIHTVHPPKPANAIDNQCGDAVRYEPVDYMYLRTFLHRVTTTESDVLIEIGCGMARTLCLFARRPMKRCIGIEYDASLAESARRNAESLRRKRAPIEVRCLDAVEADYDEGTLFWMYNPFGEATLRLVMDRIAESVRRSPRAVRIVYINPLHEHVFREHGWLKLDWRITSPFYQTFDGTCWSNSWPI